ncbi:hypothetical protein RFI_33115 [Reticulomyxa filosa]|uniref:Uncharacterized protein n=1 Tax=Reticulomyxa filosa TaxID=46433 RepID=X6LQY1_RETFI|nr:hypothetical protein RFI_33115 [Reticulomyxa filosa]|eukprot:ETO04283.1 hypothetical protein RFI_33115 [Reticulomyxa filosa]
MAASNYHYIILLVMTLFNCLASSVGLFYLKRFWELRQFPVITKRHHVLVACFNLCVFEYFCVEKPLNLYISMLNKSGTVFWVATVLEDIAFSIGIYGCAFILTARVWLLSYDVHLSLANSQKRWMHYLNSKIESVSDSHWYIQHKNTLGNEQYLLLYIVTPGVTCIAVITNILSAFNVIALSYAIKTTMFLLLLLVAMYIWKYKLPAYYDYIYARFEIKLLIHVGGVSIIAYFSYSLLRILDSNDHLVSFFTKLVVFNFIAVFTMLPLCLCGTFVVLKWTGLDDFYNEYKFFFFYFLISIPPPSPPLPYFLRIHYYV